MANNKVSSLLNVDLPKPKRSNFNLGRVNRFTADVGWVIPCYVEEILPNSYKRLDVEALIQTNATVAPLMGSFKVKVDAFFVPLRLYYRHLDLNNIRPDFSDDFNYHYIDAPCDYMTNDVAPVDAGNVISSTIYNQRTPYKTTQWNLVVQSNVSTSGVTHTVTPVDINMEVAPSSLIDYLGLLPVGYNAMSWSTSIRLNANPLIAYFDIYRNYYANPHDPLIPFRVQNYRQSAGAFDPSDDVFTRDRYMNLENIDSFVTYFTNQTDPTTVGYSKDVLAAIRTYFKDTTAPFSYGGVFHSMPLFSGSPFVAGSTDGAGNYPLLDTRDGKHFGLLRRTYMDDYFNSRFRNDFVTYMENTSTVTVVNNEFTITQLRMQNRIAKYVDKSIFSDTRFGSWIKAHFGVKTNQKLNIPQFLGSITSNIVFNDIYASAQTGESSTVTDNTALGSRASLGQGYIKNKGSFIEFQATEPGYLMCMFSIIPYVSYFQGIKKMYLKTSFNDMYKPEFDAVGYDDLQKLEMFAVGYNSDIYANNVITLPLAPNSFNVSVGKHPAWLEYMTSTDEVHGLMTQRYQYGFWLLNRPYSPSVYDGDGDYSESANVTLPNNAANNKMFNFRPSYPTFDASTYIQPEYFNNIFAVNKFTDNFQVQMRFFDKTKQPISKQILPHL